MEISEERLRQVLKEELEAARVVTPVALPAAQAAAYLGVRDEKAMAGLVRRREVGFLRVGREVVFPVAALEEYVAARTVSAEERPWGLTEGALHAIRTDRAGRLPRGRARPSAGDGPTSGGSAAR